MYSYNNGAVEGLSAEIINQWGNATVWWTCKLLGGRIFADYKSPSGNTSVINIILYERKAVSSASYRIWNSLYSILVGHIGWYYSFLISAKNNLTTDPLDVCSRFVVYNASVSHRHHVDELLLYIMCRYVCYLPPYQISYSQPEVVMDIAMKPKLKVSFYTATVLF
jgi:hypothetical protein